jgi:hypothetical protein
MSALKTIAVTSLLLGLQGAVAVADGPPKLDLAPPAMHRPGSPSGQGGLPGGRAYGRKHPGPKLVEISEFDLDIVPNAGGNEGADRDENDVKDTLDSAINRSLESRREGVARHYCVSSTR